jgi:hypothetical protein
VHLLDDLEAALDEDRGQPHRGLVHEQELRPRHERTPHRDHLLLTARKRPCELLPTVRDLREELVDAVEVLLEVRARAQVRPHLEVLEHGHRAEEPAVLGHDRQPPLDPARGRLPRHVFPAQHDRARSRRNDAEHRLQRRRLPGGVAAEQADELALPHLQVDVLEDVHLPVVRVDGLQPEERLGPAVGGHLRSVADVPR